MSEHCPQPQAHPARCGCEQAKEADWRNALRTANAHTRQLMAERDALHAEAEALQRQVTELTNQRDAILLQARCWAGEAKAQQAITKAVGEALGGVPDWGPIAAGVEALREERDSFQRVGIRTMEELEAARGLLRECHSEFDTCEASGFEVRMRQRIADFLTATLAPEVQDHTERNLEMAEQGERQEAVATVGAVIDRKRKVFSIDILDAADLHPGTKLYTTPQPGPDVRALVEALEGVVKRCSRSGYVGVDGQYLKVINAALAPYRQAQQGGSHG